jgi:hypothetical protein
MGSQTQLPSNQAARFVSIAPIIKVLLPWRAVI